MELKSLAETVKLEAEDVSREFSSEEDSWLPEAFIFTSGSLTGRIQLAWDDGNEYETLLQRTVPGEIERLEADAVVFRFLILGSDDETEEMVILAANLNGQYAIAGTIENKPFRRFREWRDLQIADSPWVAPAKKQMKQP